MPHLRDGPESQRGVWVIRPEIESRPKAAFGCSKVNVADSSYQPNPYGLQSKGRRGSNNRKSSTARSPKSQLTLNERSRRAPGKKDSRRGRHLQRVGCLRLEPTWKIGPQRPRPGRRTGNKKPRGSAGPGGGPSKVRSIIR